MPNLSPRALATLRTLCEALVPDAAQERDLAAEIDRRLGLLPARSRGRLERVLGLLDSRAGGLLLRGRGRRFTALGPEARREWLRRLQSSRVGRHRAAAQALRRIVLYSAFSDARAARPIGWPEHLLDRAPELPWEGPLGGEPVAGEAVLRVADPQVWRAPVPRAEAEGVISAADVADGTVLGCDVCVIGSGAGGAVAACRLAEAGRSVIVLEEGPYHSAADFPAEEGAATDRLYADAGLRATDDLAISVLQGRCVGGGTTVNWLLLMRPREHAMDEWERVHGAPLLGPALLGVEMERIEAELGGGRVPGDAHNAQNRVLLDGCDRLGWKVELPAISASGCVRAGTCGFGCRYHARRGALSVYLPRALAAGARVVADAPAVRIEATNGVKRVHVRGRAGGFTVEAKAVVVAAGAVGTPALLLRSGLGNEAVGSWLRLHPTSATFARFDRDIAGGTGIPQSVACTEFHDLDGGYGFWVECAPVYPGLAAAAVPGLAGSHAELMEGYRRLASAIVLVRDGRGPESQGSVDVDRHGDPRIRYRPGARERRMLGRGLAAAARIQLAAGAEVVRTLHVDERRASSDAEAAAFADLEIEPGRLTLFSAHVNGTCRMGGDARVHACDPGGGLRGVPGLWVADGSLFPTAPGVNPQLAIMALSSLVARRVLASG